MTDPADGTARRIDAGLLAIHSHRSPAGERLIEISGELDMSNAEALDQELRRAEGAGEGRIVIDLARLEFLDSSGIRTLILAQRRWERDAQVVSVVAVSERVRDLLQLSGADEVLPIDDGPPIDG